MHAQCVVACHSSDHRLMTKTYKVVNGKFETHFVKH